MTVRQLEGDDVINVKLSRIGQGSASVRELPQTAADTALPGSSELHWLQTIPNQNPGPRVLAITISVNPAAPIIAVVEQ